MSEQRTRLVPYAGSDSDFDNRKVYVQQRSYDVSQNETIWTTIADPATRK